MKMQIDNVNKADRKYFKENLYKTENRLNVVFADDKALIVINEPYFTTDESLVLKSNIIKNVNRFISDFRVYQFNH